MRADRNDQGRGRDAGLLPHLRQQRPEDLARLPQGRMLLDELVPRTYALDEVDVAFADMLAGRHGKCVVEMPAL